MLASSRLTSPRLISSNTPTPPSPGSFLGSHCRYCELRTGVTYILAVLASHAFSFVVSHSRDKHAATTALLAGGVQQRALEGGGKRRGGGGLGGEARYEMVPFTSEAADECDGQFDGGFDGGSDGELGEELDMAGGAVEDDEPRAMPMTTPPAKGKAEFEGSAAKGLEGSGTDPILLRGLAHSGLQ